MIQPIHEVLPGRFRALRICSVLSDEDEFTAEAQDAKQGSVGEIGLEKKADEASRQASSTPDELSEAFRLTMGICFINLKGYQR
jgi:hypothetical protein